MGEICLTQVVTRWRVYNFASDLYGDPKNFSYVFYFGRGSTLTIFVNWEQISENAYTLFINRNYLIIGIHKPPKPSKFRPLKLMRGSDERCGNSSIP